MITANRSAPKLLATMANVIVFFLVSGLYLGACSPPPEADALPDCVTDRNFESCALLYAPTYDEIFRRRFQQTCATEGVSCHGASGRQGGLVFVDADQAYALLLGQVDGRQRVIPGDPACSELMVRLDLPGHTWSMPPGEPLDVKERCTIARWIQDGAQRSSEEP